MKKTMAALLALASLLASSSLALAATFRMKDGSVIEGQLAERTIKLKTDYGEATIKAQDVVSYHEGILKLRDGNTLRGTILNRALRVKTSTGSFVIDPTKLNSFQP